MSSGTPTLPDGVASIQSAAICAICHEDLNPGNRMIVSMPLITADEGQQCGHQYHWTCLTMWARRSRCNICKSAFVVPTRTTYVQLFHLHSTCPECRARLETLDESHAEPPAPRFELLVCNNERLPSMLAFDTEAVRRAHALKQHSLIDLIFPSI